MDEEFVPFQNREDSSMEEGYGGEDEDSGDSIEEMERQDSDLSDEGHEGSSVRVSSWGSLPDVCLRHVFRFLPDCDRRSADLVCRHWHHVMHSPSLWRYRSFYFSGRQRTMLTEYPSAMHYVRSLGVYLERLEVYVHPPRKLLAARRLEQAIRGLFFQLSRVNARLRSLSLVRLELDRSSWTLRLRSSLVNCLIYFLQRGSAKLTSVCLTGMRNSIHHGLELLSVLSHSQRRHNPQCYISSLDLRGFFAGPIHVHRNSNMPNIVRHLQGLTHLSLSYSCVSDELIAALLHRHQGGRQHSSSDGDTLQKFSLYCAFNEPHQQRVSGDSWAILASNCPDVKVKLTVDQIINTNCLARIMLPEIPLTEYNMTAFYFADEIWSVQPLLCNMLPQYRCSLQYLTLDLSNCIESVDEELLELVRMCQRLEQLRIWAFLEISTVVRLLHIRLTQRRQLNKIKVRIYSVDDNTIEQQDQLEEILSSFRHLPPELDFYVMVYPFVTQ